MRIGLFLSLCFSVLIASFGNAQEFHSGLTKGAYLTVHEFINNQPSITDSFYLELEPRQELKWVNTYSVTPRYASNNKRVKRIWGFYDGSDVYILHQGEYFVVQQKNGNYFFYGYGLFNNAGAVSAGMIGGAIGGAIQAASEEARIRKMKVKYHISPTTGEATLAYVPSEVKRPMQKLILYREAAKQMDDPINVLVNDSLEYVFFPNSYAEVLVDINFHTVSVCYGEGMKTCEDIKLSKDEDENNETYVSCSYSTKSQQYEVIKMRHSKGEFESYKPKKEQQKQGPLLPAKIK